LQISIAKVQAEKLGLEALAFLAASPDDLNRFLSLSGLDAASLRSRAAEPHLLAAVLEFLLANEALLTRFCQEGCVDAKAVHLAAARLAG